MALLSAWRRDAKNKRSFRETKAHAEANGLRVHGVYRDGEPIYFTTPADASDEVIARAAFEARHGRAPLPGELLMIALAEQHRKAQV